jgi:AcrR family transcriptional regulator
MAQASEQKSSGSRRDEILAVAAKVIAERGLAGATVRDIGQAAGILSGSLYYHFDSKEQIVVDLLHPSLLASVERSQEKIDGAATNEEAITELIHLSVRQAANYPYRSLILRNEAHLYTQSDALKPIAALRTRSRDLWAGVLEAGAAAGEFRADIDVDVAVRSMFDSVLGSARWFLAEPDADHRQVSDTLIALFVGGLRA